MTLTLRIVNRTSLDNGSPTELVLRNRGAIIGRAATCEWPLPDDTRTLSGRHCEIQYRQDDYFLIDDSTNGTYLGDSTERIGGSHKIEPGDRFRLGPYIVEAKLSGAALDRHSAAQAADEASRKGPEFLGWDAGGQPASGGPATPDFADDGGWDLPGASPERASVYSEDRNRASNERSADDIFDTFAGSNNVDWANAAWTVDPEFDPFATGPATDGGGFAPLGGEKQEPSDGFDPIKPGQRGEDISAPLPEARSDPFGGPLDGGNASAPASDPFGGPLDGGNTSSPAPSPPSSDPFGGPLDGTPAPAPAPPNSDPFGGPLEQGTVSAPDQDRTLPPQSGNIPSSAAPAPAPVPTLPVAPAPAAPDAAYAALLAELGVASSMVNIGEEEAAAKAGRMLRHLLAGLMILLEARARAKDEMGASATQLRFDGNNPLKFARNVDQALQMMLNPPMRGYMEAEQAIEDSYRDLQAHQIATLKAMQGALRETINRFSPESIKERTESSGLLSKVMPGQREAALWKAYEKQFSGVAEGSAEAFLEVFSKEFRQAYEDAVNQ
ncbi:MAG: type VI secretion system-associated FHA domain protein TagH [Pseudomonadota bacterium]